TCARRRPTASSGWRTTPPRSHDFTLPATEERRRARESVPAHISRRHMQHPLLPQPPGRLRASWWSLRGGARGAPRPPALLSAPELDEADLLDLQRAQVGAAGAPVDPCLQGVEVAVELGEVVDLARAAVDFEVAAGPVAVRHRAVHDASGVPAQVDGLARAGHHPQV